MSQSIFRSLACAAIAMTIGACGTADRDGPAGVLGAGAETFLVGDRNDEYRSRVGIVNVCAFMADFLGPTSSFTASAPTGEDVISGVFVLSGYPGCIEVWNASGNGTVPVGATLVSNSPGIMLDRIVTAVSDGLSEGTSAVYHGTNTASVNVSDITGGYIWFKFAPRDVPPPGGQGCTPGYWKQSQHFGSWTAPYTPSTLFSDVFSNAFPGKTLLQVLGQGGGGLKALGRHSVAALLNAASANVEYDLSVAQVISAFNSAYASANAGTIEQQKNLLDMLNNQGCPLGRNP